jgi:hypothetical protein
MGSVPRQLNPVAHETVCLSPVFHGVLSQEMTFIQKPFSPLALREKIREVLGVRLQSNFWRCGRQPSQLLHQAIHRQE